VKAFLDTSVLVAALYGDHERHESSLDLLLRFGKDSTCGATHSLAEVFAVATGMPGKRRLGGDAALLFLGDLRARLTLVSLDEQEYMEALEAAASINLTGGAVYDALLGRCALKANAEAIYTWNTKDFLRLPQEIADRVMQPES
jgi:predicted nucleic acid-binding protein